MNRKISRSQMVGISLKKNSKALICIGVPLETVPTNGNLKFDSKNNDNNKKNNNNNNLISFQSQD